MKKADLHVHSNCSDGTCPPPEVVQRAHRARLSAIAIADHDTVDGVALALDESTRIPVEVIPAVELTAELDGVEIHILGYYVDHTNYNFNKRLRSLRDNRVERVYKIIEKLKGLGVQLNPKAVFDLSNEGTVGRLHIARAMVQEKIVGSVSEAFIRFIGDNCQAYVAGFRFTPREAVELIRDAKGIAVLAHPYLIRKKEHLHHCIEQGAEGLEVFYPEHTARMVAAYRTLAKEKNLVITGGSDFHGSAKPDVKLGDIKLAYTYVEKLKQRVEARRTP